MAWRLTQWAHEYDCLQKKAEQDIVECSACGDTVASVDANNRLDTDGSDVTICDNCLPVWEREIDKKE